MVTVAVLGYADSDAATNQAASAQNVCCEASASRGRLEAARLDLRALFRALDQLQIAQNLPKELQRLFELDADLAEALWALEQVPGRLDFAAMTRDTLASLAAIPKARQNLLDSHAKGERRRLADRAAVIRASLRPEEAYSQVPGRDPPI